MVKRRLFNIKNFFKILFFLTVIILAILFIKKIDFHEIFHLLKKINIWFFLLAFLAQVSMFFLFTYTSGYFLERNTKIKVNFFYNLLTTYSEFFINIITPGSQVGGQPVKAYYLGRKYNQSKSKILGIIFAHRVVFASVSVVFIIFSLVYLIIITDLPQLLKIFLNIILFFALIAISLFLFFIIN